MSRCSICTYSITTKKPSISCSGQCKKLFHLTCVGAPADLLSFMKDIPGLSWKCETCRELQNLFDEHNLQDAIDNKLQDFLKDLDELFLNVKSDFLGKIDRKMSEFTLPAVTSNININKPSYSSVLLNNTQPAVVVKPKTTQENKKTKADILQNFNPAYSEININKIKHIKDGGILLSCETSEEIVKFKKIAEDKLSDNYDVHEVKGIHPRVRIVGLSEKLSDDAILKLVVKQNRELFSDNTECKIIKCWPTKHNNDLFQVTLQLDISTYKKVIINGYILIGLDLCKVYDGIDILRCFKCNGFNHSQNNCKNDVSCPKCGDKHEKNSCQAVKAKCINCFKLRGKTNNSNIDFEHEAWSYGSCHAYKNAILKLKSDLGYQ